jgi:deazaflavin-dependent oxidoreductase (nitroreductase family)
VALADDLFRGFLRVHQAVYQGTRGALGHRMLGVPTLLMTSVGRRSGRARTAALVYAKDGDAYVVVGSNGGADAAPGWLHNVKAEPSVDLRIGRRTLRATAEVIGPSDARYADLWQLVNRRNGGRYDRYQAKTQRPIQLVRLTPT